MKRKEFLKEIKKIVKEELIKESYDSLINFESGITKKWIISFLTKNNVKFKVRNTEISVHWDTLDNNVLNKKDKNKQFINLIYRIRKKDEFISNDDVTDIPFKD